ncbi:MAG TPA: tetratricopeptide repeat protein [Gammaproteobacteria bacterium]|nr:tetratricopeptide repeat protein [Gammaproteobacteria bacterium]
MGVNLESRRIRRLQQQQPVSGWSRTSGSSRVDHPVRIHTLGRFAVQVYSHPMGLSLARQQRPLDLLKALIALGGREVHAELLSQALWPDTDGDAAQNAFDVTLHRLRRLFDIKDLFILRDRRLTLNSNLAWVDAWAFERLVNHSERLLHLVGDPMIGRQVARCSERLLNLYQGAFLEREASNAWTLTLRERLRSKLLRHMQDAGLCWEQDGNWERAIRFYRKGLEVDPLTEELYQRLIIAYRATGRRAEAIRTFHRCRLILADQFQIAPSQQTLELFHSLKD